MLLADQLAMVARSESMFGCYDSYSYRLWSLASNVWNTCQLSPLTNGIVGKDGEELNTTSSSEYYIKCPQCQKGCQSFQALKEHMEAVHADLTATSESGGPLSSNASSAVSPTPSLVGTGGPFGCTQCPTSFSTKDQLEKHELLHSPNAQVSCKICNKTFANVYRLQRHMISHDESAILRKFKCTECDKAFKFKHHLKEHIRIHSGEKPFECPNCGKRFSHSGSYSSHMTSKKCLVMNLKLGRARAPSNSSMLDSKKSPSMMPMKRSTMTPINNNIPTSPNHNSYLPILPKYEAAAAAFLQSSLASNSSIAPFYLTPPGLLNAGHPISPYTMPNLGHIFEQLQQSAASPLRPPLMDSSEGNPDDYKSHDGSLVSPKIERNDERVPKSNSSSCGELVMDEEHEKHGGNELKDESPEGPNNGDLEAVKRILETVNASVTKQFLQANMQKFSSESSSDCHSISSVHSPRQEFLNCNSCKKTFETQVQVEDHECCDQAQERSEGLAAKLEDAITPKCDEINGSISGNEDQDFERIKNEDEMDCESVTTTDHVSEDGRKVRVRSLISDEQLKVLKDNYKQNPRPKREELEKIAEAINFPVRVVQVWFQNTRARDRREGRLVTVPFTSTPMRYPLVNSTLALSQKMSNSLSISPQYNNSAGCSEQPLDLSTKRGQHSAESSPTSSPRRSEYHENPDEVVNLSRKSSRSPTPYVYSNHYQSSNSSEPRQSPSPIDFNNSSRLAQILAQPAHKIPIQGMGLVHVDQLMQLGATDLPSLTQLISNRLSGGAKKIWNGNRDGDSYHEDDLSNANKRKVSQYLGSPVLGGQELEIEGQFSCDQCDKAFNKQSSLARHKYEHSGQRPHKCDECPKAFKHKHHLTEHKRLHSGEKPFQCIKCLKRFSHSGSYSQHMNHRYSYCKPYRE